MRKNIYHAIFGILLFGSLTLLPHAAYAQADKTQTPYWKDVQVVAVNKEYPRTAFMTYDNRTDALSGR